MFILRNMLSHTSIMYVNFMELWKEWSSHKWRHMMPFFPSLASAIFSCVLNWRLLTGLLSVKVKHGGSWREGNNSFSGFKAFHRETCLLLSFHSIKCIKFTLNIYYLYTVIQLNYFVCPLKWTIHVTPIIFYSFLF